MKRKKELSLRYDDLEKRYLDVLKDNLDLVRRYELLYAQYQKEKQQSGEIRQIHENARRLKHDMKNHMMVMASYLSAGQIIRAKSYASGIIDKLSLSYSYIETGNAVLNYIINTKLELAQQKGISVKAEIENLPFRRLESIDFSALLSNLLDNAIEAGSVSQKKELYVAILKKRGYDTILIKNSIDRPVLQENPELLTTKTVKDRHGIGVAQVRDIARRYDGMLDFYEEDGKFCAHVMFISD